MIYPMGNSTYWMLFEEVRHALAELRMQRFLEAERTLEDILLLERLIRNYQRRDPRALRMAHILRRAIMERYGPSGWTCTDVPAADGESPVGGFFLKQRCEKLEPARTLTIEARMLRKPGQGDLDPATGEYRAGQFESWTRFEVTDPGYKKP